MADFFDFIKKPASNTSTNGVTAPNPVNPAPSTTSSVPTSTQTPNPVANPT